MRHGVVLSSHCFLSPFRSRPDRVAILRHLDSGSQRTCYGLRPVVFAPKQPEPNSHIAISRARSVDDGARTCIPHQGNPYVLFPGDVTRAHISGEVFSTVLPRSREVSMSGTRHICGCDRCSERIGISGKCIRNGIVLSGVLWLVLIGITLGVLKVLG